MSDSPHQRKSFFTRTFSLEGALAGFGLFSLGSGLLRGEMMPVFWGVMILAGLGILFAVRRRNWNEHWEALEKQGSSNPHREDPGPPPA
jgi:hypothetical protein